MVAHIDRGINTSQLDLPTDGMYQRWRNSVFESLSDADMPLLAYDFLSCSGQNSCFTIPTNSRYLPEGAASVLVCSSHQGHNQRVVMPTCHLRICPDCARRDSVRLTEKYLPLIEKTFKRPKKGYELRKMVLTTSIDISDPDARKLMRKNYNRVVRVFDKFWGKKWRDKAGLIVTAEFGGEGRKLHFHVLFYGRYIDKWELSSYWFKLTGYKVTWVSLVSRDNAPSEIREQIKYCTKFWSRDSDGNIKYLPPHLVPKLVHILDGTRRLRTHGIFYASPFEPKKAVCKDCGSPLKVVYPDDWLTYLETGWTGQEWRTQLDLKPGNKSPPKRGVKERGVTASTQVDEMNAKKQLVLSEDLKPKLKLGVYQD